MDWQSIDDDIDGVQLGEFEIFTCPSPADCELYLVKKKAIIKKKKYFQVFYRYLQLLYDSVLCQPTDEAFDDFVARQDTLLFCLVPPLNNGESVKVPQVLCMIAVSLLTVKNDQQSDCERNDKNLVNVLHESYLSNIKSKNACQIVKIATHPCFVEKDHGYGRKALQLVEEYFKRQTNVDLGIQTESNVKYCPSLIALEKRTPEKLDFMAILFDLDHDFLKTWRKSGFVPIYINSAQQSNTETNKEQCIMIKLVDFDDESNEKLLTTLWKQFCSRFISLLLSRYRYLKGVFAVDLLQENDYLSSKCKNSLLTRQELEIYLTLHDLKRLRIYTEFRDDYRRITDLLPILAKFFYNRKFGPKVHLSPAQMIILLSVGLQGKSIDDVGDELGLPGNQVLAHFLKAIKKMSTSLDSIEEKAIEESLGLDRQRYETIYSMKPVEGTLDDELEHEARLIKQQEKDNLKKLSQDMGHLSQYAIKGTEDEWDNMLKGKHRSVVTIKT